MKERKRLVVVAVFCLLPVFCWAQNNEVSFTAGGIKTSERGAAVCLTVPACSQTPLIGIDTGGAFEVGFAHRVIDAKAAALYLELPLIASPSRGTNLSGNLSSLFFTPSLKLKLLSAAAVSPFVSGGGGLAHFSVNSSSSNVGAGQVGGGADFRTPLPLLGIRAELRDVISPAPPFASSGALRHNVFVGGGVLLKF